MPAPSNFAELSQEIFVKCLPVGRYPTLTPHEAPLLLTRVSCAWRDLALTTPKLWSLIHVAVPTGRQETEETVAGILKCFERAQRVPMDVSLWSSPYEVVDPPGSHPVTAWVRSHSFHIRALELNLPANILSRFYAPAEGPAASEGTGISAPETSWPLLEKVVLNFGMDDLDSPTARGADAWKATFWSAPSLKSVSLTSVDVDLLKLPLPWKQMQDIEVTACGPFGPDGVDEPECSSFTPEEARSILKKCPKLSTLSINITTGRREEEEFYAPPSGPFTHNHLKDLRLEDVIIHPAVHPTAFLQDLRLPALERLTYSLENPLMMPLPHTFENPLALFLAAHNCPSRIRKFEVFLGVMSYRGLVECLRFMPALEELRLVDGGYTPYPEESSVSCNDVFFDMFLPKSMRFSREVSQASGSEPPLNLPVTGLCPLLQDVIIDEGSNLTSEGILRFASTRTTLSETNDGQYARPRRVYIQMRKQTLPDFVARDERGGTNEAEEGLWALGIDAIVRMEKPRVPRTKQTARKGGRDRGVGAYSPKAGLPRQYSGDLGGGEWYSRRVT